MLLLSRFSRVWISCDPRNCSPPVSSVHGILWARLLEWVAIPFSRGIFQTQESNPGLLHCRQILFHLSYQGSPRILEWVADPSSRGYSRPRNGTSISYTAGRFFTSWATREAPDCARHMEFNNSQNYFKRQRSWSWGIYKPGIKCKENALKNH